MVGPPSLGRSSGNSLSSFYALTCGFTAERGWLSWLLQRERDGGADEVEGLTLFAGGLGEDGDVRPGAGEADLVTGQGGQVGEQAAEAAVGGAGLVVLAGGLGLGGGRAAGGGGRGRRGGRGHVPGG